MQIKKLTRKVKVLNGRMRPQTLSVLQRLSDLFKTNWNSEILFNSSGQWLFLITKEYSRGLWELKDVIKHVENRTTVLPYCEKTICLFDWLRCTPKLGIFSDQYVLHIFLISWVHTMLKWSTGFHAVDRSSLWSKSAQSSVLWRLPLPFFASFLF